MPVRNIIKWPDPRLEIITQPIDATCPTSRALARDLLDTMTAAFGLGLAATQVGVDKSICVIKSSFAYVSDLPEDPILPGSIVLVNPEISVLDKEIFRWKEACLSVENIEEEVDRHKRIKLNYTDLSGTKHSFILQDQIAGVIQHETDHLIGKVFIDRLSSDKRRKVKTRILSKKREEVAHRKKELKRQKREEALERAQNEEPAKPGFRKPSKNKGKIQKRKKRPKLFGKNKHRKK